MTREKIVEMIKNKQAKAPLSRDDLFEIGVAHRQLPRAERSWSWLLNLTGGFSSS